MSKVEFKDFSIEVKAAMSSLAPQVLEEVIGEIESQVKQNTKARSSQLKNSWKHHVKSSDDECTATVGSPLERAIWYELGTGEYAVNGDGRQGYWVFVDDGDDSEKTTKSTKSYTLAEAKRTVAIMRKKGLNAYYTNGMKPRRPLHKTYVAKKNWAIRHIQDRFKGGLS